MILLHWEARVQLSGIRSLSLPHHDRHQEAEKKEYAERLGEWMHVSLQSMTFSPRLSISLSKSGEWMRHEDHDEEKE